MRHKNRMLYQQYVYLASKILTTNNLIWIIIYHIAVFTTNVTNLVIILFFLSEVKALEGIAQMMTLPQNTKKSI